ncbi:hypothetical protein SDC9_158931 [bioreactor metagenome]|uniref:Uncharacterized protein n=1 Tax=bioreactor metagenome TaxID=1076179 RepID=A0A645FBI5_9ZZZZ
MIFESMKIVRDVQNSKMSEYIVKTTVYNSEMEHRCIFDAIKKGLPDEAANAMYAHLSAVIERFRSVH